MESSSVNNSIIPLASSSAVSKFPVRYDTIYYRGYEINFLSDPAGVQCVGQWEDLIVDLGVNNIYYKEDMCKFVDRRLDFITDFRDAPNFVGAKLEWFNNGGFRDIRLLYRGRVIKVFLVLNEHLVDIDQLITESKIILHRSNLLVEI